MYVERFSGISDPYAINVPGRLAASVVLAVHQHFRIGTITIHQPQVTATHRVILCIDDPVAGWAGCKINHIGTGLGQGLGCTRSDIKAPQVTATGVQDQVHKIRLPDQSLPRDGCSQLPTIFSFSASRNGNSVCLGRSKAFIRGEPERCPLPGKCTFDFRLDRKMRFDRIGIHGLIECYADAPNHAELDAIFWVDRQRLHPVTQA